MICPSYNKEILPLLNSGSQTLPEFGAEKENLPEAAWFRTWLCPLPPSCHPSPIFMSSATSMLPPPAVVGITPFPWAGGHSHKDLTKYPRRETGKGEQSTYSEFTPCLAPQSV